MPLTGDTGSSFLDSNGRALEDQNMGSECKYVLFAPQECEISHLDLMDVIHHQFNDPRIASISFVPSLHVKSSPAQSRRVTFPTSRVLLVNNSFADLLGTANLDNFKAWCSEATNHGLFHIEVQTPLIGKTKLGLPIGGASGGPITTQFSDVPVKKSGGTNRTIDIAVDCSWLGENETGAQTVISYFLKNLACRVDINKIYLVNLPSGIPKYCHDRFDISRFVIGPASNEVDVYWRPCQPDFFFDIVDARRIAKRVVITYFDLIAYDITTYPYHANLEQWKKYRVIQEDNAELADLVVTISDDVRNQIIQSFSAVNPTRIQTVGVGVDHIFSNSAHLESETTNPVKEAAKDRYVLFLGTNYPHKNLDFARLIVKTAFPEDGRPNLVIAGLMLQGDSHDSPKDWDHSEICLGPVSTADRDYLLKNAELVLYPTTAEGFGLVPFEAAALGTPTLFTRFGPLREMFPLDFLPETWELDEYVNSLHMLLSDGAARKQLISEVSSLATGRLSWESVTNDLVSSFFDSLERRSVFIDKSPIEAIQSSYSWRITAPLRQIARSVARIRYSKAVQRIRSLSLG